MCMPNPAQVYDVSKFAAVHPGGPVIFTYAGKDATDVFGAFHAAETWNKLPGLCIGQYQVRHDRRHYRTGPNLAMI